MLLEDKRDLFARLHERGCFVLPNPWDRGTARLFASMGFAALGTTSAGLAISLRRVDSPAALDLETTLSNIAEIVEATDLPVQADFQAGFGDSPEAVAESVRRCAATGVAGLSIEDANSTTSLFSQRVAVDRVRAAREAAPDVVLTARAECFLVGHDDPLQESIDRLIAYADAGADCLYAPGLSTEAEVRAVVGAVKPMAVNVLLKDPTWMTVDTLASLGVRRISVGSAFARVAWSAVIRAAEEAQGGAFTELAKATPFATLNDLFG